MNYAQSVAQGVYWDTKGGCLRGTWESGILKGQGIYDQPSYRFTGNFKANLPEGECSFTICAHRSLGMPARAAAHIMADHGPVMLQKGNYTLPPGQCSSSQGGSVLGLLRCLDPSKQKAWMLLLTCLGVALILEIMYAICCQPHVFTNIRCEYTTCKIFKHLLELTQEDITGNDMNGHEMEVVLQVLGLTLLLMVSPPVRMWWSLPTPSMRA